jgi:glycosyltransferase involved in cell wall biosynthesis
MPSVPAVSVLVLTYNNSDTIEKCLVSIIGQVDVDFEIVLWDNASTDTTMQIARNVLKHFSPPYKVIVAEHNSYPEGSGFVLDALASCNAELIAFIDGDDEWISTSKLALQVRALDENPQVFLTATRSENFDVIGNRVIGLIPGEDCVGLISSLRLANHNFIPNSTVLIRKSMISRIPQDYRYLPIKDFPMWAWGTLGSDIFMLSDVTTRYNFNHGNNVSQRKSAKDRFLDVMFTKIATARKIDDPKLRSFWLSEIIDNFKDFGLHEYAKRDQALTERDQALTELENLLGSRKRLFVSLFKRPSKESISVESTNNVKTFRTNKRNDVESI